MAITITRGRSFQTNSIVSAIDLNNLVHEATITGVTLDDLSGGSDRFITSDTASSDCGSGWITFVREKFSVDNTTGCEAAYFVRGWDPHTNYSLADVAVFNPYRLESKRAVMIWNFHYLGAPAAFGYHNIGAGTGQETLVLRYQTHTHNFGSYLGSGGSAYSGHNNYNNVRVALLGLAPFRWIKTTPDGLQAANKNGEYNYFWPVYPETLSSTFIHARGADIHSGSGYLMRYGYLYNDFLKRT